MDSITKCEHEFIRKAVGSYCGEVNFSSLICKHCGWIPYDKNVTVQENDWKVKYNRFLRNKRIKL